MTDVVDLLGDLIRFDTTNPPGNEAACIAHAQRHRLVVAEPGEPRLLEVRREDRVVHVAEAVEVAEADLLAVHEREAVHGG